MANGKLKEQIAEHVIQYKENHYRLAYSYVKNQDDALDIVQESIFKAFASMDSLKDSQHIKTWFYRIVINTSLDHLRKAKRLSIVSDEVLSSPDIGIEDSYQDLDLARALDRLEDEYRSVVVLRYFEDMKLEEVAQTLNINVNTAKTRLYKALEKLRWSLMDENREVTS